MPIVAVALSVNVPVHVHAGAAPLPFTPKHQELLGRVGSPITCHAGAPAAHPDGVVLAMQPEQGAEQPPAFVDAAVTPGVLWIYNAAKVEPAGILTIRKRLATPATTPMAEIMLRRLAGAVPTPTKAPRADDVSEFFAHLQTLSGTPVDAATPPLIFTAGLPTVSSLWFALLARGGADILMASTAYGGSSQMTDILTRADALRKHTFDIQGSASISAAIRHSLDQLAAGAAGGPDTTVLFVEIPTNPDMKVPEMGELDAMLKAYTQASGKQVLLLVDATFAPGSQAPHPPSRSPAVRCSLSLSSPPTPLTLTTAGCLVANHTPAAAALLRETSALATALDTSARPDQMVHLVANHKNVETRCQKAYEVARAVGEALRRAVQEHCAHDMPLAFVKPEHAARGFTSSTFSFNLPAPAGASAATTAGLAQIFVDLLTADAQFKPCVSFGQDNGLIYCTVPATSTQGAIKEEDKAKQAVGGVQLVRLSFPPTLDTDAACAHAAGAVADLYAQGQGEKRKR